MSRSNDRAQNGLIGVRHVIVAIAVAAFAATVPFMQSTQASEVVRSGCDQIRGTEYISWAERDWFLSNCVSAADAARALGSAPTPAVQAAPAAIVPVSVSTGGSVTDQFAAGYRAAGGNEAYLQKILTRVIPCESSYNPYAFNGVGPYYGLMQFLPATWYSAGGGDWFSAWQQGANTARLLNMANPATQWPTCWFR